MREQERARDSALASLSPLVSSAHVWRSADTFTRRNTVCLHTVWQSAKTNSSCRQQTLTRACLRGHSSSCTSESVKANIRGQTKKNYTDTCSQSYVRLLPLSVELEGVKDGWSLLPQVPQVNTIISQSTHQRSLSKQKGEFHCNSSISTKHGKQRCHYGRTCM